MVEGDQRLLHEKIFPELLEAFGITDWELLLAVPEEKAEATRISFAQQRVAIANQLNAMGFTIKLKEGGVVMEDAMFTIDGEAVSTAQIQGEQQAMALEQQIQQQEQQEQQQQMIAQMGAGGAEGEETPAEEGAEEEAGGG